MGWAGTPQVVDSKGFRLIFDNSRIARVPGCAKSFIFKGLANRLPAPNRRRSIKVPVAWELLASS